MSDTGRFVWYDLMTADREAAVRFYGAVLGWGTQAFEMAGGEPYLMWTRGGSVPIGGTMTLPPQAVAGGARAHWLGYVAVDDVDASVAQATAAGAKTMVPGTDIPTVGRFAVLQDPHGASFAVYRSLQPGPPAAEPQDGDFCWSELATQDVDSALAFYRNLFGWEEIERHDMGKLGVYLIFGRAGTRMGGMYVMPQMAGWLFYVRVSDLDATVERVKEHGGQVLHGPSKVPEGARIAQCADPQGGAFALHELKR